MPKLKKGIKLIKGLSLKKKKKKIDIRKRYMDAKKGNRTRMA